MKATSPVITITESIGPEPATALAGLLDLGSAAPDVRVGAELPPLWHWLYLLERRPQHELGPDGHPTEGIPAPPAPNQRRLFAGGRITFLRPVVIGEQATRVISTERTEEKSGRSGVLTFTTVRHTISQRGDVAIVEEQDIVYRANTSRAPASTADLATEPPATDTRVAIDVDERLLFRFSALTYNAHRIHYDREWARHEGYPDLVVHGPLQALLLAESLRRDGHVFGGGEFSFRLIAPMLGAQRLRVVCEAQGDDPRSETSRAVLDRDAVVTARGGLHPRGQS